MAGFKQYQMMFQLNASMGGGFNSTFQSGSNAVSQMQGKIEALNKTQSDISAYQKQQQAIEKTKAKMELYASQLANLQNATANTKKEEAELANAVLAKEKQLKDTTDKLTAQNNALSESGEALRKAGVDTNNLTQEQQRLAQEAAKVAKEQEAEAQAVQEAGQAMQFLQGAAAAIEAAGIVAGLEKVYGALSDCSAAAAQFETAMAGVKRTVGGNDSFINSLGETFKDLSTQMPITATELAQIATTAGQLGIAQANVQSFSTVMAQLATTTDLTADNAATMLAQFANITGVTDYERLGSTVAALGDSTATTASKVVEMSQGMAAAANIAGMSETDILAIAAAVGSLGIEAASGSTSMSQLITTLYKATETGDKLEDIAAVAGMTGEQFKQAWGQDAVGAMDAFIQGLNNVEQNGRSAVVVLDDLGINNVRQTKAILGLASAEGLLSSTIAAANNAWNENTALAEKAGVMYNTTEAKMTMMQNAANNVMVAIGDALNPALQGAYDAMTNLMSPIADFIEANPGLVTGITTFVSILGVAAGGILAVTAATKLWAAANAVLSLSLPGIGILAGVAAGIGAIVGIMTSAQEETISTAEAFKALDSEYDSLMSDFNKSQAVLKLAGDYKTLNEQAESLKSLMTDGDQSVTFTPEVPEESKLTQADFGITDADKTVYYTSEFEPLESDEYHIDPETIEYNTHLNELASSEYQINELQYINYKEQVIHHLSPNVDYGVSDQTINYIVNNDIQGYDDVLEKAKDLGAQVLAVSGKIENIKTKIGEAQTKYAELEQALSKARTKNEKNTIQDEMDALKDTITDSQAELQHLETEYTHLQAEYRVTADVAQELKGKEDELAGVKAALAAASDGVITASADEAQAFQEQAEAAQAAADAQMALLRAQMYESATKQVKTYIQAVNEYEEASEGYEKASAKLNTVTGMSGQTAEQVSESYQELLESIDEMSRSDGFDPNSEAFKSAVESATELTNLLGQGTIKVSTDDIAERAGNLADTYAYLDTTGKEWIHTQEDINKQVAEYKKQMDESKGTQDAFIQNMADYIKYVGEDATRAMLFNAMEGEAGAAARVEDIMTKANGAIQAEADAAKEAAEATAALSEEQQKLNGTSEETHRSMDEIGEDIKALCDAYDKVYKSAKESMEGQFGLFDGVKKKAEDWRKVNQKTANSNTEKDKKNLEEQQQYIEQYQKNLEAAAAKGVSGDILAGLVDGSAESAAKLAQLAASSKEEIEALNQQYESLQQSKDAYAKTVAEIQTNFNTTMNGLEQELSETVQAMDMSAESAESAQKTMDAYTASISAEGGKAVAVAVVLGQLIKKALSVNPTIKFTYDGAPGHDAVGTESAPPGAAWVGEHGPELMWLNGGEKIMNANNSKKYMEAMMARPMEAASNGGQNSRKSYQVNMAPVYNIESGVNAQEVRDALDQQTARMKDDVEQILKELDEDNKRRRYA